MFFRRREQALPRLEETRAAPSAESLPGRIEFLDCVVAVVKRGLSERAVEIAREAGAGGATILHGRGSGGHDMKLFHVEVQKEKEIIFMLTDTRQSETVADRLYRELDLGGEGSGTVFMMPSGAYGVGMPVSIGTREDTAEEEADPLHGKSTAEELLPKPPGGD